MNDLTDKMCVPLQIGLYLTHDGANLNVGVAIKNPTEEPFEVVADNGNLISVRLRESNQNVLWEYDPTLMSVYEWEIPTDTIIGSTYQVPSQTDAWSELVSEEDSVLNKLSCDETVKLAVGPQYKVSKSDASVTAVGIDGTNYDEITLEADVHVSDFSSVSITASETYSIRNKRGNTNPFSRLDSKIPKMEPHTNYRKRQ